MSYYVPGTEEKDPAKVIMSLQQAHTNTATNTTDIATNTANIATNTTNIATNTSAISALQTKTAGYEAAWTAYTPTISSQTGTITTSAATGAYLAIGKLVHFCVTVTITTAGTGAGNVILALPVGTSKRPFAIVGCETAINGKQQGGFGTTSGSTHTVRNYDVTTSIANGAVLTVTGFYEAS